jgi:hypothetical protein
MGYRMMGRGHAAVTRLGREAGQGTIEYVALILLVAAVMGAVAGATTNRADGTTLAKRVTGEITSAINSVVEKGK